MTAKRNSESYDDVREWLRQHGYLRNDLAAAVKNVHDDAKGGYVVNRDDLVAYARLDWAAAEPLLRRLAASTAAPRAAALAHALLYRYGRAKEKERDVLKSIAEDTKAPGAARDIAIQTLMSSEWEGRDAWYFARFADATLQLVHDGNYGLAPLGYPAGANPDLWIPRIAPLLASPDKVVRSNAANILGDFYLDHARADALKPLIPWLADPGWADDKGMHRLRLTQSVARLGLAEAIPGLQWMCDNDKSESMRVYAAEALVELRAPDASTYARKVLDESKNVFGRSELEDAIVKHGTLSDDDIVECVLAYAAEMSTPERARKFEESMIGGSINWRATLGMRLARSLPPREALAQRLVAAAAQPGDTGAVVGKILSMMNVPIVHRWLASRLPSIAPDDAFLAISILGQRTDVAKDASTELRAALAGGGAASGIAAIALNDAEAIANVLANGSPEARQGLFAAARIVRQPLKIADVVSSSKGAEEAAEALLEILNTSEARAALAAMCPGEALIWGERPGYDPGHSTFGSSTIGKSVCASWRRRESTTASMG